MIILGRFFFSSYFSIKYLLWVSLEALRRGDSNEYLQHMFNGELEKIIRDLSPNTPPS